MANLQKRKGIWYVRFTDVDGKRKYKSCGKDAKRNDARILLAEYIKKEEAIKAYNSDPDSKPLASDLYHLINEFIVDSLPIGVKGLNKSPQTYKRECNAFGNFVTYLKQKKVVNLSQIDDQFIIKYLFVRQNRDKRAPKTLWEERRLIRKFFVYLIKKDIVRKNPCDDVPSPTIPNNKKRFFSKDELRIIINDSDPVYAKIFEFLYLSGLRSGELCNLRWCDFNPNQKLLHIVGSHNPEYDGNKYKHDTEIPTSPKVVALLEQQRGRHCEYIFTNTKNEKLRKNQIYKILYSVLKRNHIKEANVHTFRHTCASHLVMQGVSIYKVSKYLRHTSVKMTEIYAHLQPDNLIDDIAIL